MMQEIRSLVEDGGVVIAVHDVGDLARPADGQAVGLQLIARPCPVRNTLSMKLRRHSS